jgi:hypothetical protein
MSDPCPHEQKIVDNDRILVEMRIKQAEIAGDVSHIKTRLDNGMAHTIQRMDQNLTKLMPIIEHHSDIVKRIEDWGWLISRWTGAGLVCLLLAVVTWALSKGLKL